MSVFVIRIYERGNFTGEWGMTAKLSFPLFVLWSLNLPFITNKDRGRDKGGKDKLVDKVMEQGAGKSEDERDPSKAE
ncbi:hypothetical protein GCM10011391_08240 [Pullulanibacillus camelliae]|uniref:Uncharacterized protein n=1 Tax=Pullulanibacillus camelliae TaxID=1707096 RepID=A0A8J2VN13_9BACL|nr:hypothetical protein GCM10011391_08240 [Pullulanibacillus camelliae]